MGFEVAFMHRLQMFFPGVIGHEIVLILARWFIFVLVAFVVILAIRAQQKGLRHAAREAIFSGLLALYAALLLSGWIHRVRPFMASPEILRLIPTPLSEFSLPSAHASSAFGLAFPIIFTSRRMGLIAGSLAVFVALGRVLAGVHYPSDVLAGVVVGFAAFTVVRLMHMALRRTRFTHHV